MSTDILNGVKRREYLHDAVDRESYEQNDEIIKFFDDADMGTFEVIKDDVEHTGCMRYGFIRYLVQNYLLLCFKCVYSLFSFYGLGRDIPGQMQFFDSCLEEARADAKQHIMEELKSEQLN